MPRPKEIRKKGDQELRIRWEDGHESVFGFRYLRQNCACALCVDEWSGETLPTRHNIPEDLHGVRVNVVGQYALGIQFSDGHSTGIYPFKLLRQICACGKCAMKNLN